MSYDEAVTLKCGRFNKTPGHPMTGLLSVSALTPPQEGQKQLLWSPLTSSGHSTKVAPAEPHNLNTFSFSEIKTGQAIY